MPPKIYGPSVGPEQQLPPPIIEEEGQTMPHERRRLLFPGETFSIIIVCYCVLALECTYLLCIEPDQNDIVFWVFPLNFKGGQRR